MPKKENLIAKNLTKPGKVIKKRGLKDKPPTMKELENPGKKGAKPPKKIKEPKQSDKFKSFRK